MNNILFIGLIFFARSLNSQTITTIVGNGTATKCGDGGPATSACTYSPNGMRFDPHGNMYFADEGNNCIRKVDSSGIITTIAGDGSLGSGGDGGLATSAQIAYPTDVALDRKGNIYICERPGNKIRKVNTLGIISTIAGTGSSGYNGDGIRADTAKLADPGGIVLDSIGNLFIADQGNHRIRMVDTNGIISTIAGNGISGNTGDGGPASSASLKRPFGLAFDSMHKLYLSDLGTNSVRAINTAGIIFTVAGNGIMGYSGDGGPATNAQLNMPFKIAIDRQNNLFISDFSSRIRKVDSSGIISTVVGNGNSAYGGDGGPAALASINAPRGVMVDDEGTLYVADSENMRIRKVTSVSGVPEHQFNLVSVSPNPTPNIITISAPFKMKSISIYNSIGTLVMHKQNIDFNDQIDVTKLQAGLYIIRAENGHSKFIKE